MRAAMLWPAPQEREERMSSRMKSVIWALALMAIGFASPLLAQQKGQWVPGQFGLNAGVIPDPGVTTLTWRSITPLAN